MFVAWTTVGSQAEAEKLAEGAVTQRLAACAQVEGPVTSFYHWEGKMERSEEYRIWFKYLPANASALSAWVQNHHPYATPQWIEVAAENVSEKYLSWVLANSTPAPFPESKSTS
jgi:periplasmic divalent cation tolerance protein